MQIVSQVLERTPVFIRKALLNFVPLRRIDERIPMLVAYDVGITLDQFYQIIPQDALDQMIDKVYRELLPAERAIISCSMVN